MPSAGRDLQMFSIALMLIAADLPAQPMTVEIARDPITDGVRASATVRSDGHRLVVSCEPGEYDGARIVFHARRWLAPGHLLSGDRPLTYRFDSQPPRRMMWDVEDRRATLAGRRRVAYFLQALQSAGQVVIRARDAEYRRFDAIFPLKDVQAAIAQVLAACGDQPAG